MGAARHRDGTTTACTGGASPSPAITRTRRRPRRGRRPGAAAPRTGTAGGEQLERGTVRGRVDTERAEHPQLLVDEVGSNPGVSSIPASLRPPPSRPGRASLDRLREHVGRLCRHVDHDVGERTRRVAQGAHRIVVRDVDGEVGAELARDGEPFGVTCAAARDHHEPGARLFAAAATPKPRTPGPSTATTSPGCPAGSPPSGCPAPRGLNRVAVTGSSVVGTGQQQRVGREVLVLRVPAPQTGRRSASRTRTCRADRGAQRR